MGDQHNFAKGLVITEPFEAKGYIEHKYQAVSMYVGVIQVDAQDNITGAAYGMGAVAAEPLKQSDQEASGQDGSEQEEIDVWTMQLRFDATENRKLKSSVQHKKDHGDESKTLGFVLAELPGGKFTGWIDPKVDLVDGPQSAPEG
jgi:hypothetical protein